MLRALPQGEFIMLMNANSMPGYSFGKPRGKGHARIAVVPGGAYAATLSCPSVLRADLIVRLDVANEMPGKLPPRAIGMVLADGTTLATLARLATCPSEVVAFLESHAAIDTRMGLAQFRPAGM